MVYSRQNDPYDVRLAGNLLKACENGTADFLNPSLSPYYTQDMFTSQVLRDAGQLQTLLNNASHGSQYINYAPTYIFQDTKREVLENEKNSDREVGCIIYKGRDENGNKRYEMMSPAKRFNPGGVSESPATQIPVPDVGIYRRPANIDPRDPNIEKYITDIIGNYFNAAFTKTPYFPPQWGAQETAMLSKALNADPSLALRSAQQAYAQATSVKMENTVNQELNNNIREAIKQGLPPFNTQKQEAVIGPVNANGMGVPVNGVDFINSYYNSINGKTAAENAAAVKNGYVPYQTYEENPKNIDRFLVEQYSNLMNASLTGTPYSGSVTPAQLKALAAGIETKMAKDPAYMSGIVNQAQQNVAGFHYMPYNKDDFIARAQDPSSREFKLLDQIITSHIKDICKNNQPSFNGEFQELSKDLTEKIKKENTAAKTAAKPSTKVNAAAQSANTGAKTAAQAKKPSTAAKDAKKTPAKTSTTKTSTTKSGTSASKKTTTPSDAEAVEPEAKKTATTTKTNTTKKTSTTSAGASAGGTSSGETSSANNVEKASIVENNRGMEERPSFFREVTDFVQKNIVEKKPALILVDTLLGTVIDKAKKIVRTNKPIAAAFSIAADVLAPNLQWKPTEYAPKISAANTVSANVSQNNHKPASQAPVKAARQARQPAKSTVRR